MAITVRHDPSAATLGEIARRIGFSTGQENQRRQNVQEGVQQVELNQGQQRIDQVDRQAELNRRAQVALEGIQQRNSLDRIGLSYDRQAQNDLLNHQQREAEQTQELQYRGLQEIQKNGSPEIQRQLAAVVQRFQGLQQRVIAGDISQAQADYIRQNELAPQMDAVIQQYATESKPPTTEEWSQQQFATLEDGTVVFRKPDGEATLITRPDQRIDYMERQEQLKAQQTLATEWNKAYLAQLENLTDAEGAPRSATAQDIASARAIADGMVEGMRQFTGGSGFAPGESGGMPTISPEQAAQPVLQHPVYGVVSQGDILQTAKDSGMTVEEVVARLRQEGAQIPTSSMPQQQNTSVADLLRQ